MINKVVGDPADRLVRSVDPAIDGEEASVLGGPGIRERQDMLHHGREGIGRVAVVGHLSVVGSRPVQDSGRKGQGVVRSDAVRFD